MALQVAGSLPVAAGEPNRRGIVAAGLLLIASGTAVLEVGGPRLALLFLIGALLGIALFHAAFGFTSAWRRLLLARRGAGVRAQLLMLALAALLFLPALETGSAFGQPVAGAFAPLGPPLLLGAFLFGIGMQFGGGCASGTLYAAGGGSLRSAVTLAAFVGGAFLGSLHLPWWLALPSLPPVSFAQHLGTWPALLLIEGLLLALALLLLRLEAPGRQDGDPSDRARYHVLTGPWPLAVGALALALLNFATLVTAGHPWSITFGFSLWGAEAAQFVGFVPADHAFWTWPYPRAALAAGPLGETSSVMDLGLLAGAFLASQLAGRFGKSAPRPLRDWLPPALLGGLSMGYGARLAFGCNIGSMFGGIASGSLHGWLWFAAAFAGSAVALLLLRRPLLPTHKG